MSDILYLSVDTLARTQGVSPGELSTPEYWSDWYRPTLAVSGEDKRANRAFREMHSDKSNPSGVNTLCPNDCDERDVGGWFSVIDTLLPSRSRPCPRKLPASPDERTVARNICVNITDVRNDKVPEVDKGVQLPFCLQAYDPSPTELCWKKKRGLTLVDYCAKVLARIRRSVDLCMRLLCLNPSVDANSESARWCLRPLVFWMTIFWRFWLDLESVYQGCRYGLFQASTTEAVV
ncbi:unnamed protein product [Phytophthora fragariaefolia]|uniref:Unnamed protein product n=1 Tax=Phytophthora fragariaefolia TaxID=1490495 RepID=A0A9W6XLE0_9STRA|nr:unnamed protein product [Phytophthora fragariaefolia]